MKLIDKLKVLYDGYDVGTLAVTSEKLCAFQYSKNWLTNGFSLSPFSLPLSNEVFIPKMQNLYNFGGLYGVFADSLPDGWGCLLVDRFLIKNNINPNAVNSLNRLALTYDNRKGGLSYEPLHFTDYEAIHNVNFDVMYQGICDVLDSGDSNNLDELYLLGGSSGGARPKANVVIDGEDWIIKFPNAADSKSIGIMEYDYSVCARKCGIEMSDTKLFESQICSGFFGTKRFDRQNGKKIHTITASALFETSHRDCALDYKNLFAATATLTKDFSETTQLFRRMVFNVCSHNMDDHSNNFSYLFDDHNNIWYMSPAYDLTFSNSGFGEHSTSIMGEGKNPQMTDFLKIAEYAGIKSSWVKDTALLIDNIVQTELQDYLPQKQKNKKNRNIENER